MFTLLFLLLLTQPKTEDCIDHYYVRLVYNAYEDEKHIVANVMLGPLTQNRVEAVDLRNSLMRDGWEKPRLLPGDPATSPEERVAPGSFLTNSVKKMCCHLEPPMWCNEIP